MTTAVGLSGRHSYSRDSDSGYVSFARSSVAGEPMPINLRIWFRKKPILAFDDKLPPQRALERLKNWQHLFGRPLHDFISKQHPSHHANISVSLKYLGETEASAKLYLVIGCDKQFYKSVRKFFTQQHVQSQCPSEFEIRIDCREPKLLTALQSIKVYEHSRGATQDGTAYNFLITIIQDGQERYATVGGAIAVSLSQSRTHVYGLTAGHIYQASNSTHDCDAGTGDEEDTHSETSSIDIRLEVESEQTSPHETLDHASYDDDASASDTTITLAYAGRNLDWALVELTPEIMPPNRLSGQPNGTGTVLEFSLPKKEPSSLGQPVVVLCGRSGLKRGTLASGRCALMLAPGAEFVETYLLRLNDGSRLQPGDSGSWVVDSSDGEVYGHVVSTDSFGDIFVIPLSAILDDIKHEISAECVELRPMTHQPRADNAAVHRSVTSSVATTTRGKSRTEFYDKSSLVSVISSLPSSTTSISWNAIESRFKFIKGRRYQGMIDNEYWAANDRQQAEGLDIFHHMFALQAGGKLFTAPISESPQNVLDVGTGTGLWAQDCADKFPSAEVVGIDLSPIQPTWVPPNCTFIIDDAELDWLFPENHFDFIHIRWLAGSIKDWPRLYHQATKSLKPGGWIEHCELSMQIKSNHDGIKPGDAVAEFSKLFVDAGTKTGHSFEFGDGSQLLDWMADAGLVDTKKSSFMLPLGSWPADKAIKEIGLYHLLATRESLEGWVLFLLSKVYGWKLEEIESLLDRTRAELRDMSKQLYTKGVRCLAMKPTNA